ncbi:hypothetical protein SAMN06273570_4977 [Candidatus Pantoea floridensis]|uniref:Uncharacterized protein n=1 Tax=Candidatus Pantoea floridensis TaxID=1938870 RepID=A0A286DR58_9GAMM|nr:hypothetical protein BX596_5068 [Enterobacteriaceae bacterium JKS000233]SOD61136.1 hypothetical protein SAMN06273570_4977 [Pantoea floridensis]
MGKMTELSELHTFFDRSFSYPGRKQNVPPLRMLRFLVQAVRSSLRCGTPQPGCGERYERMGWEIEVYCFHRLVLCETSFENEKIPYLERLL